MKKARSIICLSVMMTCLIYGAGCVPIGIAATTAAAGVISTNERSVGQIVDDKFISSKISYYLLKQGHQNSDISNVDFLLYEGRVLLIGNIENEATKEEAEKFIWSIKGVKEVINDLAVRKNSQTITKDLWITASFKTKLLIAKNVHSANYKYMVLNHQVYLLGIAASNQELETVIYIAKNISGVKKIKNYVIIRDDSRRH